MSDLFDFFEIEKALKLWFQPEDVFEVRVLDAVTRAYYRPHLESGYFTYETISALPQALSHIQKAKGVYVTVNPVKKELLNRAVNRIRPAGREPTTSDADILCRRWLLIDCDAKRPSGIPSSDSEHDLAMQKAMEIQSGFASIGWPEPIVTDSGNGAQLMYRIELPADDSGLVHRVLQSVAAVSSDAVEVDVTVHNPARIWRLPGTMNCKGDSTPERPHRFAKIISAPDKFGVVNVEQLAAAGIPAPAVASTFSCDSSFSSEFDLDRWISEHCSHVSGPEKWKDGRKWVFDVCPFNSDHNNRSAVITQQANGAISFTCHHNGCKDKDWKALRDMLEPDCTPPAFEHSGIDLTSFFETIEKKKARKENPFEDPGEIPEKLLHIPGVIDEIVDLDLRTAPYPNRVLAFCGALTFVAHLVGRKIRDKRNNFTNIYLVALANSGTGKDHPRKTNNDIAAMAGISATIGDEFVSGAALEDTMFVSPAQLFQLDEADSFFNTLKGAKDAAMVESLNAKLLKFYSSSNSVYYMRKKAFKEKSNLSELRDNGFIYNPCLTLFGTAVTDYFYESLSKRVLENGLVARCLVIEAPKRGRAGTPGVVREHLTPEFMDKINALAHMDIKQTPLGVPLPKEIMETPEATELLAQLCEECDSRYDGFEKLHDLAAMALWARAMEKVYKLSMIYAASQNVYAPVVTAEAVRWAFDFVSHITRKVLFRAGQFCYVSKTDQLQKRFLKRLHEVGGAVSHSDIMRSLHLSKTEMREIVETLMESKQIERIMLDDKTKPTVAYREVG